LKGASLLKIVRGSHLLNPALPGRWDSHFPLKYSVTCAFCGYSAVNQLESIYAVSTRDGGRGEGGGVTAVETTVSRWIWIWCLRMREFRRRSRDARRFRSAFRLCFRFARRAT